MTTNEIRDLVSRKIEGQGNQIDLGGGLPEIINALCDLVDAGKKDCILLTPDTMSGYFTAGEIAAMREAFFSGTPAMYILDGTAYQIVCWEYDESDGSNRLAVSSIDYFDELTAKE